MRTGLSHDSANPNGSDSGTDANRGRNGGRNGGQGRDGGYGLGERHNGPYRSNHGFTLPCSVPQNKRNGEFLILLSLQQMVSYFALIEAPEESSWEH